MLRRLLSILTFATLSACGSSTLNTATIPTPVTEDDISRVGLLQGGGYSYSATISPDGLAETDAQVIDGLAVRPTPLDGTATFIGRFDMDVITDIAGAGAALEGTRDSVSGPLTLDVDFQNKTLTSRDSDLSVDATFTGNTIAGTVSYDGLDGALAGGIGARQAIGVFSREEADSIYAGGFYTNDGL